MATGLAENSAAGFRVRPARRHEAEAIAHLQWNAHAALYAPPHVDRAAYIRESIAKSLQHSWPWRLALVAEEAGKILGVVKTANNSILALYVDQAEHGRGVGSALLAAAEARLRRNGIGIADLNVARGHDAILAFYERRGWQPSSEEPPPEPVWGLRLITMSKQLTSIDPQLNRLSGWLLKALLCLAAAAVIFLAQWGLHGTGALNDGEAVAAGFVLAILVLNYTPRLHCENYTVWRNWLGIAAAGFLHVAALVATSAAGALALQASGLFAPELLDTGSVTIEVTSSHVQLVRLSVLLILCVAAGKAARHAVSLVWSRYAWLFA